MNVVPRHLLWLVWLTAGVPASMGAQVSDGIEFERSGRFADAAAAYRRALDDEDIDAPALLGLERVLTRLGKLESIAPILDTLLATHPRNRLIREVQLRTWSALGRPDSVAAVVERWIEQEPSSAEPYREWSVALARRGDVEGALRVLWRGEDRLGEGVFRPDLARLYVAAGDWDEAASAWVLAIQDNEAFIGSAAAGLRLAPVEVRDRVLAFVTATRGNPNAPRLGAALLVSWDRPVEAWELLEPALPVSPARAASVLRDFTVQLLRLDSRESARIRGHVFERLADLTVGAEAQRARLDAARAYADAGDADAAHAMLNEVEGARREGPVDASAAATLIQVTAESGRLEEAQRQFEAWKDRLRADDAQRLRIGLGWAWLGRGDLDRAEAVLQGDSTVRAQAVLAWAALYRGQLGRAAELFRASGPYAVQRRDATRQTRMLALLQRVEADTFPELGHALLWLERGDTVRSVEELEGAAALLPDDSGRSDVLVFGGEMAVANGQYDRAEVMLDAALAVDSAGPAAPLAEYALATVYAETGRDTLALDRLEHLILAHPESALLPEARRLLDQVRGAVPNS